ncbi:MAG TPA: methyltransferase domain-containing protein [Gaiellaceae bacterium]|nr:methyltransferase domain-containing protein [Gaiellaceae bacterium]
MVIPQRVLSLTGAGPDFGRIAASYDRLRPADESWRELLDVLVAEGDLAGRRVLDVGCGTGRLTLALAERGSRAWGVDLSEEMLAEARARVGGRAAFKRASAAALPFKDGWFERAVLRLVVHLVDRTRALPEVARVLGPGGRAVIATFRPEHFERFWLNPWFPSIPAIDGLRFPEPGRLTDELRAAGFEEVRVRPLSQRRRTTRAEALERIRGRFISTLQLVPEEEFREGLEQAARELPEEVEYALEWAIVVAERR